MEPFQALTDSENSDDMLLTGNTIRILPQLGGLQCICPHSEERGAHTTGLPCWSPSWPLKTKYGLQRCIFGTK